MGDGDDRGFFHDYVDWHVEYLREKGLTTKHTVPSWIAKPLGWPNSASDPERGKDTAYILGHVTSVVTVIPGLAIFGIKRLFGW